ncbi:fibroblast growth factor receptor homolog 1-like [Gigantopelta aegis]|uniref:fibroblast growth factor receptor homolog 1-like n=1 Tax=Gigantopelta aegis TaxID=1735272 RepID=UPI001B88DBDF|nr:fibroblast growth factor receptor homolog 1-like [Gigantopelta aegis]
MFIILIFAAIVCEVSAGVYLQGHSKYASLKSRSIVLDCSIVEDSNTGPRQVNVPFNLTWTFLPVGGSTEKTLASWVRDDSGDVRFFTDDVFKYSGTQHLHLMIMNVSAHDAGTYTCSSNITVATKSSQLFVMERPTCHNRNPEVSYKQTITLDCFVHFAGNVVPKLDWEHGREILNSTKSMHNETSLSARLTLIAGNDMNGHIYNCHVTYPGVLTARCQVLPPLKINIPASITAVIVEPDVRFNVFESGTNVKMSCASRGYPSPLYSWYFVRRGKTPVRLSTQSFYTIRNLQRKSAGTYRCVVYNVIDRTRHSDNMEVNITLKDEDYSRPAYVIEKSEDGSGVLKTSLIHSVNRTSKPRFRSIFSPYAIGALISAGLAILLIIIFVVLAMRMKKRERKLRNKMTRAHDETLDDQEVELLDENLQQPDYRPSEYSQLRINWEIPRQDIRLIEQIGKGSYVEVWKGRVRMEATTNSIVRVAVRKLIADTSEKERRFFISELEVLKMLPSHGNIIQLIASYTVNDPWLIMVEYAGQGSLLQYLQRHRPGQQEVIIGSSSEGDSQAVRLRSQALTSHNLLALCAQVASGLDHLYKFKLIYYRLKAAHILVGKGGVCKLSGFGFQQQIVERNLNESSSAPTRWLAPECFEEPNYTVRSDVWAYGVVMWEILHFGLTPYPSMGPQEVKEKVQSGFRMSHPDHCSAALYNTMYACWHSNPEDRPTYTELLQALGELVSDHQSHIVLDQLPEYLNSSEEGNGCIS